MKRSTLDSIISPSPLMRPAPFWSWNDRLNEKELRRQIREMAEKGWGSYFMHSRVGLVTGYLSDEWMGLINACADEASKTGTFAWLYDEDKWPSGFAGGMVPEKSETFRSRALVLLEKGRATQDDTVFAAAEHLGVGYEICRRVSPLGNTWFNGTSYIDLMSPEAVREFINCTHEAYKEACGHHFGKAIPGIFTDEPCYLMYGHYDKPVVPWSDFLADFFLEQKGYNILDKLPQLFFDTGDYRKIRFDFYDAAAELFKRSFTKQYYDWCQRNGLIMTGHFMAEDSLRYQTQWSGDVMSHYEFMNWPGIDKLGRHVEQLVTVKQVSTAVDQLGKERSFSEVFGCIGGQASFFHRKWMGDWQAALGISFVNHHLSLYSMRGERKRDYPANLFYQQPWWDEERGFADYEARVCASVSEGKRLVDILVIQPLTSVWCEYSPLHSESEYSAENAYDIPFARLSRRLMEEKLDFHYGNENLMAKYGSAGDGTISIGQHSYSVVLVPPCLNLKSSTYGLLKRYMQSGGRLVIIGGVPSLIDGVESNPSWDGAQVVRSIEEALSIVSEVLEDRVTVTDNLTLRNAPSVFVHSRIVGNSHRHFVANTDEQRGVNATVTLPKACGEHQAILDLATGDLYRVCADDARFDVHLAPAGSILVISGEEAAAAIKPAPAYLGCGASFTDLAKTLPSLILRNLRCEPKEENVLLLNEFELGLNGEKVYSGPVCGGWHTHFYPAEDGTPFNATYRFHSDCDVDHCFAVIEMAENLDSIRFNGNSVRSLKMHGDSEAMDKTKSWKDISFTKVPLSKVQRGINVLTIEGRKVNNITRAGCHNRVPDWKQHVPTEAEEVYICGRFSVDMLSNGLYGISSYREPLGRNLTVEGFPFYCGRVLYSTSFDLYDEPVGPVYLSLNGVSAASACVRINDDACGVFRWEPMALDISNALIPGTNSIQVEVATTLANAFGPNRRAGIKAEVYVSADSFVQMERFTDEYHLFNFGIDSIGIYLDTPPLPSCAGSERE